MHRFLPPALFFYEVLRLLVLVILIRLAPQELTIEALLSGVYLSSNALFLLMTLFVWLKQEEYRNYITLYISGKLIILVSFYAWMFFSSFSSFSSMNESMELVSAMQLLQLQSPDYIARSALILGSCVLISMMDTLSIWVAWSVKNKIPGGR